MKLTRLFALAAAAAAVAVPVSTAWAQDWPSTTINMVVPYPPGGATDVTGRIYARYLQEELGQPVVIDNRPGAGGEVGADYVSRADPNGYTIMYGAIGSLAIHAALPIQKSTYDLQEAFAGVSIGSAVQLAVAISNRHDFATVEEFVAFARENPGELTYGSAGIGSTQHMTGEYFMQSTGIDLVHVPYSGSGPAVVDLQGGQIDVLFETLPALSAAIATDEHIRVLAVTGSERSALLPDVPTVQEAGVDGFSVTTLYGMVAPRATPDDIIERVSEAMQKIAAMPDVQEQHRKLGAEAVSSSPEETDRIIQGEVSKWAEVVAEASFE